MEIHSEILNRFTSLGFPAELLNRYAEHHRFFHTWKHIENIFEFLKQKNLFNDDELFLAAIFHDIVYNPKSTTNEEDSAELFIEYVKGSKLSIAQIDSIQQIIIDTKSHQANSEKSKVFIEADLDILNQPFEKLIEYEHQIFKEFQFADYLQYKTKRIEVLKQLNTKGQLSDLISYVNVRQPKIALFAGSFNPFHKGHYNVLEKAERIFDKVIIAFGKNPEKGERTWPIPTTIQNRQLTEYSGLLTDFVETFGYDITVVRGLRNSTDFQYEQNQYRYIQELKPDIKIVNVFCDKEFEHISSSGIRTLEKFNKHQNYLLQ